MIDLKTITPEQIKELLEDERVKRYLALGIAAGLMALYAFFMILPKFGVLSIVSGEVKNLNQKIDVVNERVKRLDKINAQIMEMKAELGGYSKGLPDEKEIPKFLENLSSVAKISDVKILGITPSELKVVKVKGKKSGYYREMTITITARSGYHQLGQFINNLEEGERFTTIRNLEIQQDSKSPRAHRIKLGLETYVSVEDKKQKK